MKHASVQALCEDNIIHYLQFTSNGDTGGRSSNRERGRKEGGGGREELKFALSSIKCDIYKTPKHDDKGSYNKANERHHDLSKEKMKILKNIKQNLGNTKNGSILDKKSLS